MAHCDPPIMVTTTARGWKFGTPEVGIGPSHVRSKASEPHEVAGAVMGDDCGRNKVGVEMR